MRKQLAFFLSLVTCFLLTVPTFADSSDENTQYDALEKQMEEAQQQLQAATRKIAKLSRELSSGEVMTFMHDFKNHERRAMLGITIDDASDHDTTIELSGVKITGVSPGGPADKAGVQTGDIILGLNGSDFSSATGTDAVDGLLTQLKKLKPGDVAAIQVKRDDAYLSMDVVTTDVSSVMPKFSWKPKNESMMNFADDEHPHDQTQSHAKNADGENEIVINLRGMEELHELPQRLKEGLSKLDGVPGIAMFAGALGFGPRFELVEVSNELGDYFGVDHGLLLTATVEEHAPGLKAGDVILEINGKTVDSEADVRRAFARADAGDVLNFGIVRQRESANIEVTVQETTFGGDWNCKTINKGEGKQCKKGDGNSIKFTFNDE